MNDNSVNKDFIATIKANHFEYGDPRMMVNKSKHFTTMNGQTFNHKGDAMKIKANLDQKKRDDLRLNHFNIGGNSANVTKTTMEKSFRPASA